MGHTFTRRSIHLVFSTKGRARFIKPPVRERLFPYIEKVLAGRETAKYIRVGYGSSLPEQALPKKMFEGDHLYQFKLSRWSEFDGTVKEIAGQTFWISPEAPVNTKDGWAPIPCRSTPTPGQYRALTEARGLGGLKGYWLNWNNYRECPRTNPKGETPSASDKGE